MDEKADGMMMGRRRMMVAVAAVLATGVAGVSAQGLVTFPASRAELVTQAGARHALTVELASTPEQLTQGLMHRKAMAADAGMLFDFAADKPVSMWMRNTLIPLDMLFIASDGRVVGIKERAVPGSLEIISSPGAVRAVLELNGGSARRLGLRAGDRVVHAIFGNAAGAR